MDERSIPEAGRMTQAFSVLIDDEHIRITSEIAQEIRKCGFVVDRVVPAAGAIRAIGEASAIAEIRGIVGVVEVTPEPVVELPPVSERIPQ